ncbi:hypothetical protein [Streptomyces subrutilus]|uniref:Uncharacterized protein n=1 Tax=Streptomyces subrutilus TaxID=36818 RepID=A0A1E5NXX5_9ACTN|nr:hypothetical protein [Streptomyces subrutilus]OEJ21118.1 hypothetical protein BGK67_35085 [Streptomyces subrutilus]
MTTELIAQLLEEVSLLASDMRRKEPKTVPRPVAPPQKKRFGAAAPQQPEPERPRMTGHHKMLAVAMQRGMVRSG